MIRTAKSLLTRVEKWIRFDQGFIMMYDWKKGITVEWTPVERLLNIHVGATLVHVLQYNNIAIANTMIL